MVLERSRSATNAPGKWALSLFTIEPTSENTIFIVPRGPYTTRGTDYKDFMLFDLVVSGDDLLSDVELWNKYMSFDYFDDSEIVTFPA